MKFVELIFTQKFVIVLEEEHPGGDGLLFLNTDTSRFLYKELPDLAKYYLLISIGGLLVLATSSTPHTVLVVNPFATSCIKFRASMPDSLLHASGRVRSRSLIWQNHRHISLFSYEI
jgi:hypothetical protein